jgi:uncharacterized protein (DUF1330 family)
MRNRLFARMVMPVFAGVLLLGFGIKNTLHAQSKAPAYSVAEVEIFNQDRFVKEVVPKIAASVKAYGGQFIVQGGQTASFDGEPPKRIFMIRWESLEKLKAWQASKEWQEFKPLRDQVEKVRLYGVEGVPQ